MKVIKIGAKWCPGCLVMKPRWQEIEAELPWLQTEFFDFDDDSEKIQNLNVESQKLPVFIFMDNQGNEIDRINGEPSKDKLIQLIQTHKDK